MPSASSCRCSERVNPTAFPRGKPRHTRGTETDYGSTVHAPNRNPHLSPNALFLNVRLGMACQVTPKKPRRSARRGFRLLRSNDIRIVRIEVTLRW
jgi:hypothetical protein